MFRQRERGARGGGGPGAQTAASPLSTDGLPSVLRGTRRVRGEGTIVTMFKYSRAGRRQTMRAIRPRRSPAVALLTAAAAGAAAVLSLWWQNTPSITGPPSG